jgi:predicted enzyme involved in methoxymalonyl-ACP biosynthesis
LEKESDEVMFINTWFMSCRVLKRGMENFTLNTIANFAKDNNFKFLKGEYIATAKNGMVADHYKNLGFEQQADYWMLDVVQYPNKKCFIHKK